MHHKWMPERAIASFRIDGTPIDCKEYGAGHINATYQVLTDSGESYILQRINRFVFTDPKLVMENIGAICAYLRERAGDQTATPCFVTDLEGKYYHIDDDGEYWRCYRFVDGLCLNLPESDTDLYESAVAFGRFQELLRDFPAETLREPIPMFHNTVNRYRQLREALEADRVGRVKESQAELDFLFAREQDAGLIVNLLDSGELPLRVTHNDTKLNNVLLDRSTRKALCVLDLDTVMPGSSLYDFGDSIRFGAATAAEDEPDTGKMGIDLHLFRVYTAGYLAACHSLTEREIALLPQGARIITLELAARFLADYLDGDRYFRVAYPDHNLVRARAQIKLVADMEAHMEELEAIVAQEASKR